MRGFQPGLIDMRGELRCGEVSGKMLKSALYKPTNQTLPPSHCVPEFTPSLQNMPISSIAQILLRLFALNWFFTGLVQLTSTAVAFEREFLSISSVVPGVVSFLSGIVVWVTSPKLSRALARRNDGEFDFRGVTERQLYATVFLGLGLYFALSSFAAAFTWIHFFAVSKSPDYGFHLENQPSYYDLSETMMTLLVGILLVVKCDTCALKLARPSVESGAAG